MSYELIPAADHAEELIRDAKDQPFLNAAIVSDGDIILTADKDFLSLELEHPKYMTVAYFLRVRASKDSPSLFNKNTGRESENLGLRPVLSLHLRHIVF